MNDELLEIKPKNDFDEIETRLEEGLVASFVVEDNENEPLFIPDDTVQLIKSKHYAKKDFVFYKFNNEYHIKRVIKFESIRERIEITDDKGEPTFYTHETLKYFLANDNEDILHVVYNDQILGRAVARVRKLKYFSLTIKNHRPLYVFKKTHFLYFRFKNRIADYERQINYETLKKAYMLSKAQEKKVYKKKPSVLNEELKGFESPNDYLDNYLKNNEKNNSIAN